jgi:3-oxoacyl-(acyl-carrier-protein) synthase
MSVRVVITGLGVIAPNGNGLRDFELALRKGSSGLRANAQMQEAGFGCQVAGVPQGVDAIATSYFAEDELLAMNSSHRFASIAAVDAWQDAGLARPERGDDRVDWDSGAVLGTGIGGMDTIAARIVPLVDQKKVRRLGSTAVEQVMASGISARVSGLLALGNQVTTNSSACSTGSEAIAIGRRASAAGWPSACCAAAPRAPATTSGPASTRCACSRAASTTSPRRRRGRCRRPRPASSPARARAC